MPVLKVYKNGMWEYVGAPTPDEIYKQNEEPTDAPVGALWVDLDDTSAPNNDIVINLDETLKWSGCAADAKAVGDALKQKLNTSDLSTAIDDALLQAKSSGEFDGVSVTHSWNGTVLTVTSASGTSSANLKPVRGTDYWTTDDIAAMKAYVDDAILGGAW